MNNIEVKVLKHEEAPEQMMMFLARLTQRGHNVSNMGSLLEMYDSTNSTGAERVARLPHGTIKRFSPITVAVVGASRRFLAQARTHQVGIDYVSASLQYSTYSEPLFVKPYEILTANDEVQAQYEQSCISATHAYNNMLSHGVSNDTAGYLMNQAMRNILVINANHQAWDYFIKVRSCNRNTAETQYVALRIWEELLKTPGGETFFANSGPYCLRGVCQEGRMSCNAPLSSNIPSQIIKERWPCL